MQSETLITNDMGFEDLERLRAAYGIKQIDLCHEMGAAPSTYTRWKSWRRGDGGSPPRPSSLRALRRALREAISGKQGEIDAVAPIAAE